MNPQVDIDTTKKRPQNIFRSFFWFCSGANTDVLERCPKSEHIRYVGIGATVFFTGILASISSAYAFYTIFQSWFGAVILGFIWGAMIFNLDRYIVSTMKKDNKRQEFFQAFPRILLALLLAFTISKPLELKLFEREINQQLADVKLQQLEAIETQATTKINAFKGEITALKEDLKAKLKTRDHYYDEYRCECDGTCGSGIRGRGSECERKERKYTEVSKEYDQLKQEIDEQTTILAADIEKTKSQRDTQLNNTDEVFATGLLARLDALSKLPFGPSLAILLLIIAIETAPIFTKLLSPRGPYDDQMKALEHAYVVDSLEQINHKNQKLNKKLTLLEELDRAEIEHELANNRDVMKAVSDVYMDLVKEQLNMWLKEQRKTIKDNDKTRWVKH